MDALQALQNFWSSFGIPAYDEQVVPDDATLPYITYQAVKDFFGDDTFTTANIYYRSTTWAGITAKEKEISEAITRGGRLVKYDGGAFWIKRSSPWAQRLYDASNDTIRRIVLNITIEFME